MESLKKGLCDADNCDGGGRGGLFSNRDKARSWNFEPKDTFAQRNCLKYVISLENGLTLLVSVSATLSFYTL